MIGHLVILALVVAGAVYLARHPGTPAPPLLRGFLWVLLAGFALLWLLSVAGLWAPR